MPTDRADGGAAPTGSPWVAESLDELVAGATDRVEVRTSDAKSGARFERLVLSLIHI